MVSVLSVILELCNNIIALFMGCGVEDRQLVLANSKNMFPAKVVLWQVDTTGV